MKKLKQLFLVGLCTIVVSCNSNNNVVIDIPKIKVNKETCIKIYYPNKAYGIVSAFIDCNSFQIDSNNNKIKDCTKALLVEHDTIKIYFAYNKKGSFYFDPIRILLKSKENYMICDTIFKFKVE